MATANPYLNFNGNTEEAFNFYKSVFGGEFAALQRFGDIPGDDSTPPENKNMIMHVALPIGGGNMLMGTDAPDSMGFKLTFGNNYYICLSPDSEEEAHKLFDGLSVGGKIEMQLEKMFWGALYGSFADQYGVQWMINYTFPA